MHIYIFVSFLFFSQTLRFKLDSPPPPTRMLPEDVPTSKPPEDMSKEWIVASSAVALLVTTAMFVTVYGILVKNVRDIPDRKKSNAASLLCTLALYSGSTAHVFILLMSHDTTRDDFSFFVIFWSMLSMLAGMVACFGVSRNFASSMIQFSQEYPQTEV